MRIVYNNIIIYIGYVFTVQNGGKIKIFVGQKQIAKVKLCCIALLQQCVDTGIWILPVHKVVANEMDRYYR